MLLIDNKSTLKILHFFHYEMYTNTNYAANPRFISDLYHKVQLLSAELERFRNIIGGNGKDLLTVIQELSNKTQQALNMAQSATQQATVANTNATSALNTANTALTIADQTSQSISSITTIANEAKSTAETANEEATEAKSLAEGAFQQENIITSSSSATSSDENVYSAKKTDELIATIPGPDLSAYSTTEQCDAKYFAQSNVIQESGSASNSNVYSSNAVKNLISSIPPTDLSNYFTKQESLSTFVQASSIIGAWVLFDYSSSLSKYTVPVFDGGGAAGWTSSTDLNLRISEGNTYQFSVSKLRFQFYDENGDLIPLETLQSKVTISCTLKTRAGGPSAELTLSQGSDDWLYGQGSSNIGTLNKAEMLIITITVSSDIYSQCIAYSDEATLTGQLMTSTD